MINYIKIILPALFVIAISNIDCYSAEKSIYYGNKTENQEIVNSYVAQLCLYIENIFTDEILNRQKYNSFFIKYPQLEKKLNEIVGSTCKQCRRLIDDFDKTKNINKIGDLLEEYYYLINEVLYYIEQYVEANKHANNYAELEAYYKSVKKIRENELYPLFNQKLIEYKRLNPIDDVSGIKFYYKEIESLKALADTISQNIEKIKTQCNKTFSKIYLGRFKNATNAIIELLNKCRIKLENINQDNYLDTTAELQSNIMKLIKTNSEYSTMYSKKYQEISNHESKNCSKGTFYYKIADVYELSQLINYCCTDLYKSFYNSINNDGHIMSSDLAFG
jgi:hypothetical protein